MDSKTKIIIGLVLIILLVAGIAMLLYLIKSPELPIQNISRDTTTTVSIICSRPYVVIGNRCCTDNNNNSICDIDENMTTIIIVKITTTTIRTTTTTTTSTTTSTTIPIKCYSSSDCGNASIEYKCYEGNVNKIAKNPICYNSGTSESYCKTIVSRPTLIARCNVNEICIDGIESCQKKK